MKKRGDTMKRKVVGYVRDSMGNDKKIQKQMEEIINFAVPNFNVKKEEIDFFCDKTGTREERDGFNQMMEKIKQNQYSTLIVVHINRIYRIYGDNIEKDMNKLNELVDKIKKYDVDIISVREKQLA